MKNFLNKAFNVCGIISGGTVLLVSVPVLVASHVKYKKKHPELKGSDLEMRDDILVTYASGSLTILAVDVICKSILSLKKK